LRGDAGERHETMGKEAGWRARGRGPRGRRWVEVDVKAVHYSAEARARGMEERRDAPAGETAGAGSARAPSRGRPRPVRWKRRTVNRSPHGNKTAREQFVQKIHGRTCGGRERRWGGRKTAEGRDEGRRRLTRRRKSAETVWKGGFVKVRVEGGFGGT